MNFQTLNFRNLGLPPVGLGIGQYILVGEARRKKAQFFPFFTFGTCSMAIRPGVSNAQRLSSFFIHSFLYQC